MMQLSFLGIIEYACLCSQVLISWFEEIKFLISDFVRPFCFLVTTTRSILIDGGYA